MDDRELMEIQAATLFRFDERGRIVGSNEPQKPGGSNRVFNLERLSPFPFPEGKAKRTRHGQQFFNRA